MSYEFYKVLHFFGIALMLVALSGACFDAWSGGTRSENPRRRLAGFLHGLGAVLAATAGFGLMARLGYGSAIPGWVWGKVAIWALLSAAFALPYRLPARAAGLAMLIPVVVLLAAFLAVVKPF